MQKNNNIKTASHWAISMLYYQTVFISACNRVGQINTFSLKYTQNGVYLWQNSVLNRFLCSKIRKKNIPYSHSVGFSKMVIIFREKMMKIDNQFTIIEVYQVHLFEYRIIYEYRRLSFDFRLIWVDSIKLL